MKRVITSGGGYGYAPETHLYYVAVVVLKGVKRSIDAPPPTLRRLRRGKGRRRSERIRVECTAGLRSPQMYRCVDDVNAY